MYKKEKCGKASDRMPFAFWIPASAADKQNKLINLPAFSYTI